MFQCLSIFHCYYFTWLQKGSFVFEFHGPLLNLNQFSAPELSEETVPKLLGIANLLKVRRLLLTNRI